MKRINLILSLITIILIAVSSVFADESDGWAGNELFIDLCGSTPLTSRLNAGAEVGYFKIISKDFEEGYGYFSLDVDVMERKYGPEKYNQTTRLTIGGRLGALYGENDALITGGTVMFVHWSGFGSFGQAEVQHLPPPAKPKYYGFYSAYYSWDLMDKGSVFFVKGAVEQSNGEFSFQPGIGFTFSEHISFETRYISFLNPKEGPGEDSPKHGFREVITIRF